LFFATFLLEWISGIFNFEALYVISRSTNILFFIVIVVLLIRQIALSKEVRATAILGSIAGYLLLGMVFSFFITIIVKNDPGSYSNLPPDLAREGRVDASVPLYYSFVTLASLGYGDICPLKPYTRSLATLIAVSGQFYIAIIVALLVGKFSSKSSSK
jgi:amino acid transporter